MAKDRLELSNKLIVKQSNNYVNSCGPQYKRDYHRSIRNVQEISDIGCRAVQ